MFITTASANSALVAGPCLRESCDGTWSFLTSNRGTELRDEIQSLVVANGPDAGINIGSLRLYHDLGSKAMHGAVHLNGNGQTITFTLTLTQTDIGAGADNVQFGSDIDCGPPHNGVNFCDTKQIGTDGTLADCFVTSIVWSEDGVAQNPFAMPSYCVSG